ncbi:MAG: hypothetical protein AAGJ18_26830, partial [Bacteroidota bacterium]
MNQFHKVVRWGFFVGCCNFLVYSCQVSTESTPTSPSVTFSQSDAFSHSNKLSVSSNQQLQVIMDRLLEAVGDTRYTPPAIVLSTDTVSGASYLPGSNTIVIEEKIVALSRRFGVDSSAVLAFFIGHELGHFFQFQRVKNAPATSFLNFGTALPTAIQAEKTADMFGVFSAYLAGYFTSADLLPTIIEALYEAYGLHGKNLQRYESFDNRKQMAEAVKQKADTLRRVFEIGNMSALTGQYELAQSSYEYLLNYYQGGEIYNNLALTYVLQAQSINGKRFDKFQLPMALTSATALSLVRADQLTPAEYQQRQSLLAKADYYLSLALTHSQYCLAFQIHQFCLYILQEKWEKANDYYARLQQQIEWSVLEKEQITLAYAVLLANQKKYPPAERLLTQLKSTASPALQAMVEYNLRALREAPPAIIFKDSPCPTVETTESEPTTFPPYIYETLPTFRLNNQVAIGWLVSDNQFLFVGKQHDILQLKMQKTEL